MAAIAKFQTQTDSEAVREFTAGAGQPAPTHPTKSMTDAEVKFLTKMILDETMELMATILPPKEAKEAMKKMIDDSKDSLIRKSSVALIASSWLNPCKSNSFIVQ